MYIMNIIKATKTVSNHVNKRNMMSKMYETIDDKINELCCPQAY